MDRDEMQREIHRLKQEAEKLKEANLRLNEMAAKATARALEMEYQVKAEQRRYARLVNRLAQGASVPDPWPGAFKTPMDQDEIVRRNADLLVNTDEFQKWLDGQC